MEEKLAKQRQTEHQSFSLSLCNVTMKPVKVARNQQLNLTLTTNSCPVQSRFSTPNLTPSNKIRGVTNRKHLTGFLTKSSPSTELTWTDDWSLVDHKKCEDAPRSSPMAIKSITVAAFWIKPKLPLFKDPKTFSQTTRCHACWSIKLDR